LDRAFINVLKIVTLIHGEVLFRRLIFLDEVVADGAHDRASVLLRRPGAFFVLLD
jgi:hypothetical protein